MKKYSINDQKILATWSTDCAKRVLPFFEKKYPKDKRPRKAIKTGKKWARTGVFKMTDIRGASLSSHAAARKAKADNNDIACFAARAAGQAVATAHVTQHALGGAYYAIKAIIAKNPAKTAKEYKWQLKQLPKRLRREIAKKLIIQKRGDQIIVKIIKDKNF